VQVHLILGGTKAFSEPLRHLSRRSMLRVCDRTWARVTSLPPIPGLAVQ
jgi:hypothetical protein